MPSSKTIAEQNRELAKQINDEAKEDAHSQYAGKFVGIASGQVVVVADTLRDAVAELRRVEPDAAKCCCIEANYDYDQIHDIWAATG